MVELKGISHVNLRVADQEVSKRFYRDLLGFVIAEEDPEHGGVFMTLGDNFHTVDIGQHPAPETARRPERGQIGCGHISFQVASYAALRRLRSPCRQRRRDPARHSAASISPIPTATRSRSITSCRTRWEMFPEGRADQDEELKVSGPGDPLPDLLLGDWPAPEMKTRTESLRRAAA
jgi:catechol 2,3-dioxygenase-like lactoylglutathione lyase family enzyme